MKLSAKSAKLRRLLERLSGRLGRHGKDQFVRPGCDTPQILFRSATRFGQSWPEMAVNRIEVRTALWARRQAAAGPVALRHKLEFGTEESSVLLGAGFPSSHAQ